MFLRGKVRSTINSRLLRILKLKKRGEEKRVRRSYRVVESQLRHGADKEAKGAAAACVVLTIQEKVRTVTCIQQPAAQTHISSPFTHDGFHLTN